MTTKARFLVLWSQPDDPEAFQRHYREVHIPLAVKMPGLRRYTISTGATPIRGGDPYYMIGMLDFDDMDALKTAFSSPEGQATGADVPALEKHSECYSMVVQLEDVFESR